MEKQLQLNICEHFRDETLEVIRSDSFSDVKAAFFPARCGQAQQSNRALSDFPQLCRNCAKDTLMCACSCLSLEDKSFIERQKIPQLALDNCFKMLVPPELVESKLAEGAYVVTSGWLKQWESRVKKWGAREPIQQMFSESVSKLVLFDTGIDAEAEERFKAFAAFLDRPHETIPLGLDFYRLNLENLVFRWRIDQKETSTEPVTNKAEADYAMALDLVARLPRTESEEILANRIIEDLIMMFAAERVRYVSFVDAKPITCWSQPLGIDSVAFPEAVLQSSQPTTLNESGDGFYLRIERNKSLLAIIELEELSFPEKINQYRNLAHEMGEVFALAIENSRFFNDISAINAELKDLNLTKDKLFSIIAHDLRSPFSGIVGLSELLLDRWETYSAEEAKGFLGLIGQSAEETLNLLDNLLDWARSQTGQMKLHREKLSLAAVFREVREIAKVSAQAKAVALNSGILEDLEVFADANLLKTILRNLVSNAVKFTESGGEIHISAKIKDGDVAVTVADTGVGMSEETVKGLFSLETNKSRKGTQSENGSGLGLLLCHELVKKHGGEIRVASQLGEGSQFSFTLPLGEAPSSDRAS